MKDEYLAGFFDGEGCINFTVRGKQQQVSLRCMLVNTDFGFLSEVQAIFGGSLVRRPHKKNLNWKPFCSITWTGNAAADLLMRLQPFLRLKAPQAKLALEFIQFRGLSKSKRCDFTHIPAAGMPSRVIARLKPEISVKEFWFKEQMHILNRKGLAVQ